MELKKAQNGITVYSLTSKKASNGFKWKFYSGAASFYGVDM